MTGFTSFLGLGIRRSSGIWQSACKIIRTTKIKNADNCLFSNTQVQKIGLNWTVPATRYLSSSTLNSPFIRTSESFSLSQKRLFVPTPLLNTSIYQPEQRRSLIKFSKRSCKRKTVKTVIRRFYRLHWGTWIRTKAGKNKHYWRKSIKRRQRMKMHLFCNRQQSRLLNHMTTKFWKRRRYYIDDPYEPYHERHGILPGNVS